jgi:hypothetical protein
VQRIYRFDMWTPMAVLVAILCFALAACVGSQSGPPPPAPLQKLTVYVWMDPGPHPSFERLAQDKATCLQEAEQRASPSMSDRWHAHIKRCMERKGWGEKAVD